jgi:hypothetical protein
MNSIADCGLRIADCEESKAAQKRAHSKTLREFDDVACSSAFRRSGELTTAPNRLKAGLHTGEGHVR